MMLTAKIKSKATYHKCIKELHDKKYIIYKPSYNPYTGSEVILPDLSLNAIDSHGVNDSITEITIPDIEPNLFNSEQTSTKDEPMKFNKCVTSSNNEFSEPLNEPTPPKKDTKKDLTVLNFDSTIPNFDRTVLKNGIYNKTNINTNKTISAPTQKKEKNKTSSINEKVPPNLDAVKNYFKEKNIRELEAEKFFNYYNSNGWLIGGKTPMKDWKAAVRNWILNLEKFNNNQNLQTNPNPNLKPNNLNVSNNKDYAEPL
ncbi:transcriptional regulator [Flavobacterium palustre]|uniref:Transcriptional regulator n=2 Tax=Flavobacterium palustre TaxID=1476463 RepID=A0ABQ1HSX6_9FLAO|nr:transcriptional regulator [Flavobacterium palustre]